MITSSNINSYQNHEHQSSELYLVGRRSHKYVFSINTYRHTCIQSKLFHIQDDVSVSGVIALIDHLLNLHTQTLEVWSPEVMQSIDSITKFYVLVEDDLNIKLGYLTNSEEYIGDFDRIFYSEDISEQGLLNLVNEFKDTLTEL